jgi:hypothetical protein
MHEVPAGACEVYRRRIKLCALDMDRVVSASVEIRTAPNACPRPKGLRSAGYDIDRWVSLAADNSK